MGRVPENSSQRELEPKKEKEQIENKKAQIESERDKEYAVVKAAETKNKERQAICSIHPKQEIPKQETSEQETSETPEKELLGQQYPMESSSQKDILDRVLQPLK